MMKYLIIALLFSIQVNGQLNPGFDKEEYLELMRISVCTVKDSCYSKDFDKPKKFELEYQSGNLGLDNSWDLWTNHKDLAVISIRGTTKNQMSWLENFYAAMVPAKGKLFLDQDLEFEYDLAENPEAAVHVGWLVGLGFLSQEIVPKIKELHNKNIKNILIIGHSQGGGIAYLLTSYLYRLQMHNQLPNDIRFKTYCSAAPKPGNLFFAYEYEQLTQNGWGYNVVNPLDWVPETPFSIQTLDDFNNVNPFKGMKAQIKKEPFPKRLFLKMAFNRLDNPTRKAQKNYKKYLGSMTYKVVKKYVKHLKEPAYFDSNNYVRTGSTIVLKINDDYKTHFKEQDNVVFTHHMHSSYMYLLSNL